ncbi:hypothetical protein [Adhaeribacter aquaticus]|uniref:hypothetical protein n=1 Tax=Adhaeribacter aquaticus TaxID=299567 RepID=UPI00040E7E10|nr:hypothetical protein [Adhaeribacter aquaticus]
MKNLILSIALLVNVTFLFAAETKSKIVNVRHENVKMYRQSSTSTEILKSLKSTDEVVLVRKHNELWSIVTVNETVGYVLTSELVKPKRKVN